MAIFTVLITVAIVVPLLIWASNKEKKRLALWQQTAVARGGTFHKARGSWLKRKPPAIEVDVGRARVFLDTYVVSSGKSSTTYTRVRALLSLPAGPKFRVYREGVFSTLGKALGTQDVTLGTNPEFDNTFMVKTEARHATTAMWTSRAMKLLLRELPQARVICDTRTVELVVIGVLAKRRQLEAALDIVGDLASADLFGFGALEKLPDAEIHPASGRWNKRTIPFSRVDALIPVDLSAMVKDGRVFTIAEGDGAAEVYQCELDVDDAGRFGDEGLTGTLPEAALSAIRRVGAGSLIVGEGRAVFAWDGVEADHDRLAAGVELIAAFATSPRQGAFR